MKDQSITENQLKTGFPFICYGDYFALCGQPRLRDLKEFKEEDWMNIINLRSPQEMEVLEFDVPKICQELALNYNHIPVIVDGDIDKEALKKVHKLLSTVDEEQKFVIHCASGARSVAALIAHFIFSNSHQASELPALAEKLGLYHEKMLNRLFEVMDIDRGN